MEVEPTAREENKEFNQEAQPEMPEAWRIGEVVQTLPIELEDITERLRLLTKEYPIGDKGLRGRSLQLSNGTSLILSYSQGRSDLNYSSIGQIIPGEGGRRKTIQRRWLSDDPKDESEHLVTSTLIRPDRSKEIEYERHSFNFKDIRRMKKLLKLFEYEAKAQHAEGLDG
jgi:hypothetical protein